MDIPDKKQNEKQLFHDRLRIGRALLFIGVTAPTISFWAYPDMFGAVLLPSMLFICAAAMAFKVMRESGEHAADAEVRLLARSPITSLVFLPFGRSFRKAQITHEP